MSNAEILRIEGTKNEVIEKAVTMSQDPNCKIVRIGGEGDKWSVTFKIKFKKFKRQGLSRFLK